MSLRYMIRPLGTWLEPKTEPRQSAGRFKAPWSSTLELLQREVGLLGAELLVVQVDVTEAELRRDGMLRAGARVDFPGVRVSFDSHHGPLTYATDAYEQRYFGDPPSWQANLRAIALGLEALRAVDRYGVSRRGEQYVGWAALPNGQTAMTREEAARLLAEATDGGWSAEMLLRDAGQVLHAYRRAARVHHPDVGGDGALFGRLTTARDVLDRMRE